MEQNARRIYKNSKQGTQMIDKSMLKYLNLEPEAFIKVETIIKTLSVSEIMTERSGKNPYSNSYESTGFAVTPKFVVADGNFSLAHQVLISYLTQIMYLTHLLITGVINESKVAEKRTETATKASMALNSMLK